MTVYHRQCKINLCESGVLSDDCYNVVESLDDLPAPVAGVRTLPAGTATLICGVISLPPGETIVVPNDSILWAETPTSTGFWATWMHR